MKGRHHKSMATDNNIEKITDVGDDVGDLYKHMSSEDDLGVALRAAIYIENQMDLLIQKVSWSERAVARLNLDYTSKIDLALILGLEERFRPPLSCIGSIRNRFAHQITTSINKSDADGLYECLSPEEKNIIQQTYDKTRSKTASKRPKKFSSLNPLDRFKIIAIALRGALVVARQQAPDTTKSNSV